MVSYRRERERTDQGAKSSEAQGLERGGPNVPYPERVGVTPRGGEVVSGAPAATRNGLTRARERGGCDVALCASCGARAGVPPPEL